MAEEKYEQITEGDVLDLYRQLVLSGNTGPYMMLFHDNEGNQHAQNINGPMAEEVAKVYPGDASLFPFPHDKPPWVEDFDEFLAIGMVTSAYGVKFDSMGRDQLLAYIGYRNSLLPDGG